MQIAGYRSETRKCFVCLKYRKLIALVRIDVIDIV